MTLLAAPVESVSPDRRDGSAAALLLRAGKVIGPEEVLEEASVRIEEGRITAVGSNLPVDGAHVIEARDKLLLPGIVDLHSDALEKFIEPRRGARFDYRIAIAEFDKAIVSCGITTMFHCVAFVSNPTIHSLRSPENAARTVAELNRLAPRLNARNYIHARYDKPSPEALPLLRELVCTRLIHLVSLMDHTPGQGQFRDPEKLAAFRGRQWTEGERRAHLDERMRRQERIDPAAVEALVELCHKRGLPLATHDDDSLEKVAWAAERGITISEFPVELETAVEAQLRGIAVGLGAPNALRGGSHSDNLSAREALSCGIGDFLCSDYAPMAMLHAVFLLHNLGFGDLAEMVRKVTLNPARAAGVGDRLGSVEEGKAADLILIDIQGDVPRLSRVFVAGREVLAAATR